MSHILHAITGYLLTLTGVGLIAATFLHMCCAPLDSIVPAYLLGGLAGGLVLAGAGVWVLVGADVSD